MSDRELVQSLRDDATVFVEGRLHRLLLDAAARLDALRWRSVEEGELPEAGWYVETVEFGEVHLRFAPLRVTATHWRYVTTPSREGGGQ